MRRLACWIVPMRLGLLLAALLVASACTAQDAGEAPPSDGAEVFRVLVFSKTEGYRHASIADGIAALRDLGTAHGFAVDATEDASAFRDTTLATYAVVVFLSTTGEVLDAAAEAALQGFVQGGGGFVGIHAASDTEYDWPWYGALLGAYFDSHPEEQTATVVVPDTAHPSTADLPERWERFDEWYNFQAPPEGVRVLARLDASTYDGGTMGDDHPIAWCHEFDGGRAWYTAGGHTAESYAEPLFRAHLLGGIRWAAGRAGG
ncbi:MAG: ThuA domain-containing protein [Bacteroidota bacterium]